MLDVQTAVAVTLANQRAIKLPVSFTKAQALFVYFGLHRFGDQCIRQLAAMPGTCSEFAYASGEPLRCAARPAELFTQRFELDTRSAGENLGGQRTLAWEVTVQAAGGDACGRGQPAHVQRCEPALGDLLHAAIKDVLAQRLIALRSCFGGPIRHGLNPDSYHGHSEAAFAERYRWEIDQIAGEFGQQGSPARNSVEENNDDFLDDEGSHAQAQAKEQHSGAPAASL